MGSGRARRKQKMQPESGAAPRFCHSSCHARAEQSTAGGGFAGTCRSINLHAERVKSWPLPDFPAGHGAAKPAGPPAPGDPAAADDRRRRPPGPPGSAAAPAGRGPGGQRPPGRCAHARLVELQHLHRGRGEPVPRGPDVRCRPPLAPATPAAIRAQPRPFEARIGVGRIVEPRHAAREQRRGEARPRNHQATAAAAARPAARPAPPCRPDRRARSARAARMATVSAWSSA